MVTKVNGYIISVGSKAKYSKTINHLLKQYYINCYLLDSSRDWHIAEDILPDDIDESGLVWGYETEYFSEWDAEETIGKVEAYLRKNNHIKFFSYSIWVHSNEGGFDRNSYEE